MNKTVTLGHLIIFFLLFSLHCASAQAAWPDSPSYPDADSTSSKNVKKANSNKGFFSAITFWKNNNKPKEPVQWHQLAHDFLGVQPEDFYINGYARVDDLWVPTLFVRRFNMMKAQYEHILLIKGVPENKPDITGISVEKIVKNSDGQVDSFALSVKNIGFNFEMPVIPSVSREEKKMDQRRAVELASMQLEFFGFDDYVWIDTKSNQLRHVADTWQVNTVQK